MSQPMMVGFVPAATILIVASQVPAVLGTTSHSSSPLIAAATALGHPGNWQSQAFLIAAAVGVGLILLPRIHPLFPAILVASGGALVYSKLAHYGGTTIGSIPSGLPPLTFSLPWGRIPSIGLSAIVIAVVGFAEPAAIARTFAAQECRQWNANREFISQGVANLVAGFTGGMPVGGSFSRSALNRLAGAKSTAAGAVTRIAAFAFLFAAHTLAALPVAALSAIVIVAMRSLIRPREFLRIYRYSIRQFAVAAITFAATLAFAPHVEYAILLGVALAIGVHLHRELSLGLTEWVEADTLHLRPGGVLWYGSVPLLEEFVYRELAEHPNARKVVVHCDGLGRIDLSGALVLRKIQTDSEATGVQLALVDVPRLARPVLTRVHADAETPTAEGA